MLHVKSSEMLCILNILFVSIKKFFDLADLIENVPNDTFSIFCLCTKNSNLFVRTQRILAFDPE